MKLTQYNSLLNKETLGSFITFISQHISSKRRSITQLCLHDKVESIFIVQEKIKTHAFNSAAQSLKLHEMLEVLDTKLKYYIIIIYIVNA